MLSTRKAKIGANLDMFLDGVREVMRYFRSWRNYSCQKRCQFCCAWFSQSSNYSCHRSSLIRKNLELYL